MNSAEAGSRDDMSTISETSCTDTSIHIKTRRCVRLAVVKPPRCRWETGFTVPINWHAGGPPSSRLR
uniref:Uncharacterized protein n=1 Tax=Arundo donax TaxID=35708 RepID=A0A0A9EWK8_ARUDO